MEARIAILGGDGIGPEVTAESIRVLDAVAERFGHDFTYVAGRVGGNAIDEFGTALPQDSLNLVLGADAVLFGAVGGPKWDNPELPVRPEDGILKLRKNLGLFANLRPCKIYPQLIDSSPLKPERIQGVDFVIVRELTGGLYFGKPKRKWENSRGRRAVDTLAYTEKEIERVVRVAFELARRRRKVLHSVDKMNVMETSRLWREVTSELSVEFHDVELNHMLADNAAIQMVTNPSIFDVIVTENMFGDILSDEASMLTGSIGMLPSASISTNNKGLFEPVHGSAPDIAGQGIVNPIAMILSFSMMLEFSLGEKNLAKEIKSAINTILKNGFLTKDLSTTGKYLSTSQIGDKILESVKDNVN